MKLILLCILMGFPLLEGVVLYQLASGPDGHTGWVLAWLAFATVAGVVLIKQARFSLVSRLASAFSTGQFSLSAFIDSFRSVLAGLLLIFPGVVSDVMALTLLLLPLREPALQGVRGNHRQPPRNRVGPDGVIEGEFRRD